MTDYLKLFQRIPDDVVLAVSARDLEMANYKTCICGWAIRESLARAQGKDADETSPRPWNTPHEAASLFGGTEDDWYNVFLGTLGDDLPKIERAWVRRLDKAVRRSR